MNKNLRTFAIALIVIAVAAAASSAATMIGLIGDGKTSIYYSPATGAWSVQPDGQAVGVFDIQSASGIFTAPANLPAGALFSENSANRKSWAALPPSAFLTDFSLGVISAPDWSLDFLLQDLTLTVSGGFGTANRPGDLGTLTKPL